jgi:hypothetical protein
MIFISIHANPFPSIIQFCHPNFVHPNSVHAPCNRFLRSVLNYIISISIYHKLVMTSLATCLLQRSYIYGGNQAFKNRNTYISFLNLRACRETCLTHACLLIFLHAQTWGGGAPDGLAWRVGAVGASGWTRSQGWSAWASSN